MVLLEARRHGLHGPFNSSQAATWVGVPVLASAFILTALNYLEDDKSLIAVSSYAGLLGIFLVCYLCCTFLDPAKPALIKCCTMNQKQRELKMYCPLCQKTSIGFDHHCVWLNTCVGSRQYPFFFMLAVTGWLTNCLHIVLVILLYIDNSEELDTKIDDSVGSETAFRAIIGIQGALALMAAFSFTTLLTYHIGLQCKGYGTYQDLLNKRQKKRAKAYGRASTMRLDEEPGFCERLRDFCSKNEEDAASTMNLTISRTESNVVRRSLAEGSEEVYSVGDRNEVPTTVVKKSKLASPHGATATTFETSVEQPASREERPASLEEL